MQEHPNTQQPALGCRMPTSRQLCIITHTLRRPGGRRGPCEARRGLLWRGWTDAVVPRLAGWGAERCHRHCQPHIHPSAVGIRRGRSGSPGLLAACLGAAIAVHPGGRTAPSRAYAPRHYAAPRARCKDWRFNGVHGTRACRQGWRQRGLVWSFVHRFAPQQRRTREWNGLGQRTSAAQRGKVPR